MQRADQVVGAADPKSGGPEISRSAGYVLGRPWFNSSAAIVNAIYILFSFLLLCTSFETYIQNLKLVFPLISFICFETKRSHFFLSVAIDF